MMFVTDMMFESDPSLVQEVVFNEIMVRLRERAAREEKRQNTLPGLSLASARAGSWSSMRRWRA